jgi:hypothetical protein
LRNGDVRGAPADPFGIVAAARSSIREPAASGLTEDITVHLNVGIYHFAKTRELDYRVDQSVFRTWWVPAMPIAER